MKSKWQFVFTARGFGFDKTTKFRARTESPILLDDENIEITEFDVEITPNIKEEQNRAGEQIGKVYITIQGRPDSTEKLAYQFSDIVTDKIAFEYGGFNIDYSYVACERILETDEEREEIGEGVFSVKLNFEEVIPDPVFEPSTLNGNSISNNLIALVKQFNETKQDDSVIKRFLGFFRVLESLYHSDSKSIPLKKAFKSSSFLKEKYKEIEIGDSFEEFIDRIVNARHQCAHLKVNKDFGYFPAHPEVSSELIPLEPLVAHLAYISIKEHENA